MSLTVATWIGAIATMVLAAGAIVTVYYARKAFREQAEEVRTLKRQLGEQSREAGLLERQIRQQQDFNELQAPVLTLQAQELRESLDERKRAQAAHIYFELGKTPPPGHVTVVPGRPERDQPPWRLTVTTYNASTRPVYDLELRWQLGHQRLGQPDRIARLGPDRTQVFKREVAVSSSPRLPVSPDVFDAVLVFRDAAGVHWRTNRSRRADRTDPRGRRRGTATRHRTGPGVAPRLHGHCRVVLPERGARGSRQHGPQ